MMLGPKVFALGAVLGDFAVLALKTMQAAPASAGDLVGGGAAGGVVSVALWWVYKDKVDQHTKEIDKKADTKDLEPIKEELREIKADIQYLVRRSEGGRTEQRGD